jgi:hypothetical protein
MIEPSRLKFCGGRGGRARGGLLRDAGQRDGPACPWRRPNPARLGEDRRTPCRRRLARRGARLARSRRQQLVPDREYGMQRILAGVVGVSGTGAPPAPVVGPAALWRPACGLIHLVASLGCRLRRARSACPLHPPPAQALQQGRQLRRGQPHHPILHLRPVEGLAISHRPVPSQ